jgi:hypothetical protein
MAQEFPQLALVPVAALPPPAGAAAGISAPVGPGWFDSSWDLHRGLEVREGWPGDNGLRAWIDELFGSQLAAGRIASPSASTAIA